MSALASHKLKANKIDYFGKDAWLEYSADLNTLESESNHERKG